MFRHWIRGKYYTRQYIIRKYINLKKCILEFLSEIFESILTNIMSACMYVYVQIFSLDCVNFL